LHIQTSRFRATPKPWLALSCSTPPPFTFPLYQKNAPRAQMIPLMIDDRKWRLEFEVRSLELDNPSSNIQRQNPASIFHPLSSSYPISPFSLFHLDRYPDHADRRRPAHHLSLQACSCSLPHFPPHLPPAPAATPANSPCLYPYL